MPKVHPTAVVHPEAVLAEDVEVGPYCLIESDVQIGPGCRLRNHVTIRRYTTMGRNNIVDAYAALGGDPQDYKFDQASVSYLRIGDDNFFREGVTISRGTGQGSATVVGNKTYWMAHAHAGHNAVVEDEAILVNGSGLGGYARLGRKAILSANAMVHQFCWIGRMVMTQGQAGASTHVPPYVILAGINRVVGLNVVGLRRAAHISQQDRGQIKQAFGLLYRSGLRPAQALERMDQCGDWGQAAVEFREFVRAVLRAEGPHHRPLCGMSSWTKRSD